MVDANTKFSRDLMWAEACLNKVKAQFAEKDGGPPTKDWDTDISQTFPAYSAVHIQT